MTISDVIDNDVQHVIMAAEERRKRDQDFIVEIGSLLRWQTAMIIKGFHDPKDIKKTDWELFEHERQERLSKLDVDTDKYEELWRKMDEERELELKQRNGQDNRNDTDRGGDFIEGTPEGS